MRKNSVVSRSRPSPSQNNTNNIAIIRPKRCHNCQKMFPADKFDQHVESCFRFRQSQKIANNQKRSNSIADNPSVVSHATTLSTTKSRIINGSQLSNHKGQANLNKNRLVINNNVVIPGKASSNITRKGPHKNIGNSATAIAQRKFKKNQNPQQQKIQKQKIQRPIVTIKEEQKRQQNIYQKVQKIQEPQKKQQNYETQISPPSRNIRINSRPGSATRGIPMQLRVAEQNARLADFYNGNTNRPLYRVQNVPQQDIRGQQKRVSMSSQSGYESSQLVMEETGQYGRRQEDVYIQRQIIRIQESQKLQKERQRQLQRQRLRQHYRLLRQQERRKQRERQLQRQRQERQERLQRQRQRARELQRQRQRQLQRQRQIQRQRQRHRERERQRQQALQTDQPRVNIDLLVQTTNQIINFVQQLSIDDESLTDMLNQLRHLNAISTQIRQLNTLGRNLGFRMGVVFAQRIQQLQNVIMNQIGIVLIRSFHNNITQDFQRLLSLRPTQPIVTYAHFNKQQIQTIFPLRSATKFDECSICLQQIIPKQGIRQLQCDHNFHTDCIDGWLLQSRKCPMCRHEQVS